MKRIKILKFGLLIFMLAFSAGIFFLTCGFTVRLPNDVKVNGYDVGGKTYAEAAFLVRGGIAEKLKEKSLTVLGREKNYVFAYPEIGWKDDLQSLLKNAKKGESYTTQTSFYLKGLEEIASGICADESIPVIEPYPIFNRSGAPFTYVEGNDGALADRLKLIKDIRLSLGGAFNDVKVEFKTVKRNASLETVKYNTRLLSTFTTNFDGTNKCRAHNIALAAQYINGTVLENGEKFSFNKTVGERTKERGFMPAKIISGGEFVEGIGGGVCQVSTTLFNAALLSGCEISEFHAHSLAVSYVPPSFDAMVSGDYFDLKFENLTGYTLYIRAVTGADSITFNIYGRGDGASYGYHSVVTGNIAAPERTTDDPSLVKDGKNGVISEGYLTVIRNGIRKTVLFRRDKYKPMARVVAEGS